MKTISLLLALLMWAAPCAAQTAEPMVEYVAHRGESADAPENTMAAFRLAWQRNDPAIELDIHLTKDGNLIVSHDANTKRTTGVDRVIEESTLAELRALDAGLWKGSQWAGERLPTLEEVLAELPEGTKCIIEIKEGPEVVPALTHVIHASGKEPEQLAIISFNLDAVAAAKKALPDIKAYYLSSFKQDEATGAWTPTMDALIEQAKAAGLDGLDLAYKGPFSEATVGRIKDAGLELYVWTVDDPAVARRMRDLGVDGITTNRADWLRAQLGQQ